MKTDFAIVADGMAVLQTQLMYERARQYQAQKATPQASSKQ